MSARAVDGFDAVGGDVDRTAEVFEHLAQDVATLRMVLGEQDFPALEVCGRGGRALQVSNMAAHPLAVELEAEAGSLADPAIDADGSTHHLHQSLADGEPEPAAALAARGRTIDLSERLKKPLPIGLGDAFAGIADAEAQSDASIVPADAVDDEPHRTGIGEFEGVAAQVDQHLRQAQRIAVQPHLLQQGGDLGIQAQALVLRLDAEHAHDPIHDIAEPEVAALQRDLFGLDLGQVEDVVEDGQQMF